MKISAIKETAKLETRVALTPESAKSLSNLGFKLSIEKGAGLASNYRDKDYEAYCGVSAIPLEILADSDIILKVQPSLITRELSEAEFARKGSIIIGLMNPHNNKELIEYYAKKEITLIAMELMPRTTKAQSFDVLSSQSNLIGYRAVIEGAYIFQKAFPMFMTAAGTINPAKVLVLGAGVAGLQAIATSKRLGASVFAYDVRIAAKEQVESLGAKFIHPDESADFSQNSGYASEVTPEFLKRQDEMLESEIAKFDIVITTAMIPGRKAPILITKSMVGKMREGSVIVDIASNSGGNCELTKAGDVTSANGVKIIGYENFAARIAEDASKLYAKNISNFIAYAFKDKKHLDLSDEIIKQVVLTHKGEIYFGK
jgi:NAD(P) transhydrogenase subunit alpha